MKDVLVLTAVLKPQQKMSRHTLKSGVFENPKTKRT